MREETGKMHSKNIASMIDFKYFEILEWCMKSGPSNASFASLWVMVRDSTPSASALIRHLARSFFSSARLISVVKGSIMANTCMNHRSLARPLSVHILSASSTPDMLQLRKISRIVEFKKEY